jgi:hypothetical protein
MKQVVKAIMERGETGWLASTMGLPDEKQALAVGKSWRQTARMLQDAAERTLRVPPDSVTLDLKLDDPNLQSLVDEVKRTQAALRDARFEAGAAMGHAARTLTKTMTIRDVAAILGCSPQYVAKLAPKKSSS